ncbi:MAG: hypothetical protein J6T10_32055 [Methanobrevibacter sp.]|nr:hypothetical protein [Methanobrevibacter sp.]
MLNMIEPTTLASAMWLLTAARNKLETEQMNLYQKFLIMISEENKIISRNDLSGEFIDLLAEFQENQRLVRKHNIVIDAINHHLNTKCEDAIKDMKEKGEAEI